ncbi:MAG: ADP-forming succinate--CoA ligase subunit beta [Parachlamydiaceae bacterium]|nr:ADP-forming succinate--CoA ligase subunit beta [Parachlamydiaceae bacterium]
MNIHEFQAKIILQQFGIHILDVAVVSSLEEVEQIIEEMDLNQAVLKVQVHAGGRGKTGGVKVAKNRQEIIEYAKKLLGMKIINNQTGPEGVIANQILISPLFDIAQEYYIGAIIDRKNAQAMFIASPAGGMDIEEVAANTPEKILTFPIGSDGSLRNYQLIHLANFMGWQGKQAEEGKKIVKALAKAFIETDASLLEINPLIQTSQGELIVLDAKLSVDDNALYRQQQIAGFYDPTQIPSYEAQAKEFDLAYVALDGEIGCMVNGAGLAMATMDIIHLYGGSPANFLDVGGGATKEKVAEGFKIILSDPKVKAILVNIFGGIMNCVTLAAGIIAAAGELMVKVPLIVRMEGTNVDQGKKMLADSGLNIVIADTLASAAEKVVAASLDC